MGQALILDQFEIGPMQNFAYFIGDPATRNVCVVDPAWDAEDIVRRCREKGYCLAAVLLTHGHYDHTNALADLLAIIPVPVYVSKHEPPPLRPQCPGLRLTGDHERVAIGAVTLECLHTPGHTPGSQCFYGPGILITGDTLFIDGCGRCDLPGGNPRVMYQTLYSVILPLPGSTVIYPGHNYGTVRCATLDEQRKTNPYLQSRNLEEFLSERM